MREEMFAVSDAGGTYRLDKYLGEDVEGGFRLYRCLKDGEPERWFVFKVAAERAYNGVLDKEAWLLADLRDQAFKTEEEYKKRKGSDVLNYQFAFPRVEASFLLHDHGGRRANVLAFDIADDIGQLVPLSMVREKDQARVDLKTSAWIVGKLLKTLVFIHSCDVSIDDLAYSNLLVQRENHLVSVFNWTRATQYQSAGVPKQIAIGEIQAIARAVLKLLSVRDGLIIPESDQDTSGRYVAALEAMTHSTESDPLIVHTSFYELVEELWGRKYHPWTTMPL